ncbi:docking protein 5-like [Liolophura sinensis]|uniref:docking protein 5-like n=1 Tax=Liolophura sinensis TaxID=3198878 RepID=UPI0031594D07
MTTNFNDIVKQGYVRLKSGKVGLFKKKWLVLKKASSTGPSRLERYEDETSAKYGVNKKDISLGGVEDVSRLPSDIRKCAFAARYSDNTSRQFLADSDIEADHWVSKLRHVLFSRCSPSGNEPDVVTSGLELDLKNIYHVCLLPSTKLDFHGECLMQVTCESIHLFDCDDPTKRLITWPIRSLRRYGQDHGKFTFEAGRSCDTGEGMFGFSSQHCQKIYNQVNDNAHAIAGLSAPPSLPAKAPPKRSLSSSSDRHSINSNSAYYGGAYQARPPRGRPLPPPPADKE